MSAHAEERLYKGALACARPTDDADLLGRSDGEREIAKGGAERLNSASGTWRRDRRRWHLGVANRWVGDIWRGVAPVVLGRFLYTRGFARRIVICVSNSTDCLEYFC